MKRHIASALIILTTFFCSPLFGQETPSASTVPDGSIDKVVKVETLGGGTFQGKLLVVSEDRIEVLNSDGLILQISRAEVKSVVEIKPENGGNPYFQDASSNRLIVMPTGFGLEEKEFHIADLEIIGVTASYGVSKHFSVWSGVSIPGAVFNARFSFTLADGTIGTSLGSFAGVSWSFGGPPVLIPYVITSVGSENKNVTVGAGGIVSVGGAGTSFFDLMAMVAVLGGKLPLSATTALITENWILFPVPFAAGGGVFANVFPAVVFRIAGNRLSWDIGATFPFAVGPLGIESTLGFPIPILTLTYRIN